MVFILKLMFFLVILQLTLASTVVATTNTRNEPTIANIIENDGTTNTGNENIAGTAIVENDDATNTGTNAGSNEINQVVVNQNPLILAVQGKAVQGIVTPDPSCGDDIFDKTFDQLVMGEDAIITTNSYNGNLIAMVPEAEWNQDAIENCEATKIVYCSPSEWGNCKYTELGSSSVPVRIVGSTGPNGEPNVYILHPTPFSAIAAPDALEVAILAVFSSQ